MSKNWCALKLCFWIHLGACYIFINFGRYWLQEAKLQSALTTTDRFGIYASLDGDTENYACSAVYIYTRSGLTWNRGANLFANDGKDEGQIGRSLQLGPINVDGGRSI